MCHPSYVIIIVFQGACWVASLSSATNSNQKKLICRVPRTTALTDKSGIITSGGPSSWLQCVLLILSYPRLHAKTDCPYPNRLFLKALKPSIRPVGEAMPSISHHRIRKSLSNVVSPHSFCASFRRLVSLRVLMLFVCLS